MRISDWSSDVCSSDLAVLADVSTQRIPVQRAAVVDFDIAATLFAQHCQGVLRQNAAIPQRTLAAGVGAAFGRQLAGSPIGVIAGGFHGTEIGRASCRERVCQYVEISVVPVSFK